MRCTGKACKTPQWSRSGARRPGRHPLRGTTTSLGQSFDNKPTGSLRYAAEQLSTNTTIGLTNPFLLIVTIR
jgi:hypothetical protein